MSILNYKAYAKAVERGMSKKNMSKEGLVLFGFIVEHEAVLNKFGEPYNLDNRITREWYKGISDIPENIKKAAGNKDIKSKAPIYFEKHVFPELIIPAKEVNIYPALLALINGDPVMAVETKNELRILYESGKKYHFLAEAFLYAITTNNCAEDIVPRSLDDELNQLNILLSQFKKRDAQDPPDEIAMHEMEYVKALLDAYAEVNGLSAMTKEELSAYPKYQRNFDRQRKDYYAAEAIRESTRDAQFLQGREDFTELKAETYEAVVDVYESPYSSGYERLNKVLEHVTAVQLVSLLARIPNWIGPRERKGLCHMLVNDGKMRWVNDEAV